MKILLLTNKLLNSNYYIEKLIRDKLNKLDKNMLLHVKEDKIKLDEVTCYDFIISFGYRFIVKKPNF